MVFSQYLSGVISAIISIPSNHSRPRVRRRAMDRQKNVLVVTNSITEEEVIQIKNALESPAYTALNINLNLVHVIPNLPTCYFNIPSIGVLVEKYFDEAKETLHQVGRHLCITKKEQWLITGKIRTEVLKLATKLNTNFVLAGAKQIQEIQHSLFFKNIHQYALIKNINHLHQ